MQTCRHADMQTYSIQTCREFKSCLQKNESSVLQLALSRIPCQTGLKQRKTWRHGEIENVPFRFSPLLPLSTLTTMKLAQVCCLCAGEHVHNDRKYYLQKREDGDVLSSDWQHKMQANKFAPNNTMAACQNKRALDALQKKMKHHGRAACHFTHFSLIAALP